MKNFVIIFTVVTLAIMSSCLPKGEPIKEADLIGNSFRENVEISSINYSQSSIITFHEKNLYDRTGIMYVHNKGNYCVRNNILEIHYACGENCNNNSSCGIQQYILGQDGNLHLIYLRESDGHVETVDETAFDLILEKLKK